MEHINSSQDQVKLTEENKLYVVHLHVALRMARAAELDKQVRISSGDREQVGRFRGQTGEAAA